MKNANSSQSNVPQRTFAPVPSSLLATSMSEISHISLGSTRPEKRETSGEWFELKDAAEYIGTLHPEFEIPTLALSGRTDSIVGYEPALSRLGLTRMPWKDSVREAAEALARLWNSFISTNN